MAQGLPTATPTNHTTGKGRKGFHTQGRRAVSLGVKPRLSQGISLPSSQTGGSVLVGIDARPYCPWVDFGEQL